MLIGEIQMDAKTMELFGRIHKQGKVLMRGAVFSLICWVAPSLLIPMALSYWVLFDILCNVIVLDQKPLYTGHKWTHSYDSKIDTFMGTHKFYWSISLTVLAWALYFLNIFDRLITLVK